MNGCRYYSSGGDVLRYDETITNVSEKASVRACFGKEIFVYVVVVVVVVLNE